MSRKGNNDDSLIYDRTRLDKINTQVKRSSLYSNYIWTSNLHTIDRTSKPDYRPEFSKIKLELDKYKEKNKISLENYKPTLIRNASSVLQTENFKKKQENSQMLPMINKLNTARYSSCDLYQTKDEPYSSLSKFKSAYKDLFEGPKISPDSTAKHQKLIKTIMNYKTEIKQEKTDESDVSTTQRNSNGKNYHLTKTKSLIAQILLRNKSSAKW